MNRQTEQLWATLHEAGLTEGVAPATDKLESPWYVKVLLGFSGWLAAVFLLGFIGVGFEFILKNSAAALAAGGMMICAAFALLRIRKNEFVEHLALAVSLAGQGLVTFAIFDIADPSEHIAWLLLTWLQALLAIAMPHFVHRVFSSFIAAFAMSMVLTFQGWPSVVSGAVMLLAAWCWLNEFRYSRLMGRIRAIGYGQVLALIQLKGTALFGYSTMGRQLSRNQEFWAGPWTGEVLTGMVALYVVWRLLRRYGQRLTAPVSLAAVLGTFLLCVASLKVQGITVGMTIMLLGFAGASQPRAPRPGHRGAAVLHLFLLLPARCHPAHQVLDPAGCRPGAARLALADGNRYSDAQGGEPCLRQLLLSPWRSSWPW